MLLLRKQALDQGSVQRMPPAALANTFVMNSTGTQVVKQAAGFLDTLKAMPGQAASLAKGTYNAGMDRVTTDPGLRSTLGYGLAGAGLGALGAGGLAASRKEKDWKRRLLQGATAGGLLGGGLGLALNPGSVTKGVEDKVTDLAEKSMQAGPKTEAELKSDRVKALQSTANSSPGLGALVPAGIGAGSSPALGYLLGKVPGLHGLDRRALAHWMMQNPNAVNWNHFVHPKLTGGSTQQFQLANYAANLQPLNAQQQREMTNILAANLPRTLQPTAASLSGYIQSVDPAKAEQAATVASNKNIFSNVPKQPGHKFSPVIRGNLARFGVSGIPAAIGAIWSLLQYRKDLAAQQQATQQLRDLTPAATKP